MPATKLLANFKTAAQLNSQILPRVLKLNLNQMQQSPAVSLLLIAVHLFGTMAVLTGVSAETKETFNKSFQSLTEIGRLTSRPFTSVGVRPNWSSDQFTEGSFVVKTVSLLLEVSSIPRFGPALDQHDRQGEENVEEKHLWREHLTPSVRDVRGTFPPHFKTPFELLTKNKPISNSAITAPINSLINSTLPLVSSFTGKGRKQMTTLTTEEEKTNMSPCPPLYTTPPGSLLHLMKRDTKLSNAVVDPYGNGPSEYDFMLQLRKHHAALAVASTCALTKYDLFEFFVLLFFVMILKKMSIFVCEILSWSKMCLLFSLTLSCENKKRTNGSGKKRHGIRGGSGRCSRKTSTLHRRSERIFSTTIIFVLSSLLFTFATGEFVEKSSGTCAELADGWPVLNAVDCTSSAVALGWTDTTPNVGTAADPDYPKGCYFKHSSSTLFLRPFFTGDCTSARSCSCWIGACTQTSGALTNPSACMCGTTICSNSTGLFCYKNGNQCSANIIPVCDVVNGMSKNANSCTCGSSECDSTTGLFCLASSNQCRQTALCTNTQGSSVNANNCTCGSSPCTTSTGLFCLESANACSSLARCHVVNGSSANPSNCICRTTNCDTRSGMFCMEEENRCSTIAKSDESFHLTSGTGCHVTNSGTCFQTTNYPNNYDASRSCTITLSNKAIKLEVKDFQVEASSTCTYDFLTVGGTKYCGESGPPNFISVASGSEISWTSDSSAEKKGFKICVAPDDCAETNGANQNDAGGRCMCGSSECDTTTGLFCLASSNQCRQTVLCTITNGSSVNAHDCTCGSTQCNPTTGLFCQASLNQCAQELLCASIDGSSVNANNCKCGSNTCSTSIGLFCVAALNACFQAPPVACNIPAAGDHELLRSSMCILTTKVTVAAGTALNLSSTSGSGNMAIISGGSTTQLFDVSSGILTITELILEHGKSKNGGALHVIATSTTSARVHLRRSVVRGSEATSWGGAAYVKDGAVLVLEESVLELNVAGKRGGGVFAESGAQIEVIGGRTSVVKNNKANGDGYGGGFYLESEGTRLDVSGTGTRLVVDGNTAEDRGGGV